MGRLIVLTALLLVGGYAYMGCTLASSGRDTEVRGVSADHNTTSMPVDISPEISPHIDPIISPGIEATGYSSKIAELRNEMRDFYNKITAHLNNTAGRDVNSTTLLLGVGAFVVVGLAIVVSGVIWGMHRISSTVATSMALISKAIDRMDQHQQKRDDDMSRRSMRFMQSQADILNAVHGLRGYTRAEPPPWINPMPDETTPNPDA